MKFTKIKGYENYIIYENGSIWIIGNQKFIGANPTSTSKYLYVKLYKNGKLLLVAPYWEDLVNFVEIIKKYNKKFINRKDFIIKCNDELFYYWKTK